MRCVDLAYIAGLFDGEGSITGSTVKGMYRSSFTITNTNREVLDWVADTLKYGKVYVSHDYPPNKVVYYILFYAKESRVVLPLLLPYLKIKKRQVELLIQSFKIIDTMWNKNPERAILLAPLREEIKFLNRRNRDAIS